ncbi:MAG: hypothetical protein ABWJ97_07820 [Thermoproteus sp.]
MPHRARWAVRTELEAFSKTALLASPEGVYAVGRSGRVGLVVLLDKALGDVVKTQRVEEAPLCAVAGGEVYCHVSNKFYIFGKNLELLGVRRTGKRCFDLVFDGERVFCVEREEVTVFDAELARERLIRVGGCDGAFFNYATGQTWLTCGDRVLIYRGASREAEAQIKPTSRLVSFDEEGYGYLTGYVGDILGTYRVGPDGHIEERYRAVPLFFCGGYFYRPDVDSGPLFDTFIVYNSKLFRVGAVDLLARLMSDGDETYRAACDGSMLYIAAMDRRRRGRVVALGPVGEDRA